MKRTLTIVLNLACVCVPLLELSTQAINSLVIAQTTSSNNKSNEEINRIAKKITVQILQVSSQREENLIGTGFIVKKQTKQGNNSKYDYQVLTNDHVIKKLRSGYQYQVKTYDEDIYKASLYKSANNFNNYDLAILTFTSYAGYQTAKLGNSDKLQPEDKVFVAGFPCESIRCKPKLTIKSGVIAPIEFLLQGKTLAEGYKIGYDIDVEPGTSGGPIIDTAGEVVGVNGRSKSVESAFANAPDPYTFTDNTQPDKNIKLLMRYFAWGIPIETYTNLNNNTKSPIESISQTSLSTNSQDNSYPNLQAERIVPKSSSIGIIILVSIVAVTIIISIVWFLFNQWDKYKNEPRFKAIEEQQKKLESHILLNENQQKHQALEYHQKHQALEDNQKQYEYNSSLQKDEIIKELKATINNVLSSQKKEITSQLSKLIELEQKLSSLEENLQQLESQKALIEQKKHQEENVQNTSSTEE